MALVGAVLLATALHPSPLRADPLSRGIDTIPFKLAPGDAFATVESPDALPTGQYRLELAADGGLGLLSLRLGEEKIGNLVGGRLDLHLLLAAGLPGGFELGLDLPVTVHQSHGFELLEERGVDMTAPSSRGAGDTRLIGKLPLPFFGELGRDAANNVDGPWSAALVAELRLPTGDADAFIAERGLLIAPRAVIGWEGGDGWRLAGTAGYRFRVEPGRFLNLYVGDELHAGIAAARALPRVGPLSGWDVFGEVLMATPARAPFAMRSAAYKTPLEILAGTRLALPHSLEARLIAGTGLSLEPGFGRPALRLAATFGYAWPARPAERPPARAFRRERSEGDPSLAHCPPVECRPVECPPIEPPVECPPVECPPVAPPVEVAIAPEPEPEPLPPEPEPVDPLPETTEDSSLAVLEDDRIDLRETVRFNLGKASLQESSLPVLDDIQAVLENHPEIRRVRIDGHTDNIGSAAHNMDLSRQRAQTVVDYLVEHGIDAGRLTAEGFGQERPIATNETPAGRARNRRVEITILEHAED